jgi:hypothetical protein
VASNRYVFISGGSYSAGEGVLIDGRTGRRRTLSRPGCLPDALGGPWLAFTCGTPANQTFQLYDIPTGQSRPFNTGPALGYGYCTLNCVPIAALGTDWVAFEAPPGDYHDYPTFEFQNIKTGQALSKDPTNATTTVNLDSPQLAQKACRPLTVPVVSGAYDSGWGSLTFVDGFVIAAGGGGAYLERCGSHRHEFLTFTTPGMEAGCPALACPPVSNSHAIMWQSAAGRLSGILLPSRQRFMIHVPAEVDPRSGFASEDPYTLALTPRTLYLVTPESRVWSIPAPTSPSPSKHHNRLDREPGANAG